MMGEDCPPASYAEAKKDEVDNISYPWLAVIVISLCHTKSCFKTSL